MKWFMPCKLGALYPETKFVDWTNGTRIFGETGKLRKMTEVYVGIKAAWADVPEEFRGYGAYDERGGYHPDTYNIGKWNFERFVMEIPDAEFEEKVLGKKKVQLIGVKHSEKGLLGHYITLDRYEHFYEPINIVPVYTEYTERQYIHFDFKEETTHGEYRWNY